MDSREETQKYPKGTTVIFLPTPNNKSYKHSGKKGKVQFQEIHGTKWYIYLDETEIIHPTSAIHRKEVPIKVLGEEDEFMKLESARP